MSNALSAILGVVLLLFSLFLCQGAKVAAPVAVAPPAVAPITPPSAPAVPAAARLITGNDGKVTLEGTVRDEAMRNALVTQAKSVYGEANVIDKLTLDAKLGDLGALTLTGVVGSQKIKEDTGESVKKQVGANVRVDNQLTVAAAAAQSGKLREYLKIRNVEFATGSAILTAVGVKTLMDAIPIIQEDKTTRIEIQGHTDNVGAPEANKLLSSLRAQATMQFLIKNGVDAARLTAVGYGQDRPVADNNTDEGRQHNRRIDFDVAEGK